MLQTYRHIQSQQYGAYTKYDTEFYLAVETKIRRKSACRHKNGKNKRITLATDTTKKRNFLMGLSNAILFVGV